MCVCVSVWLRNFKPTYLLNLLGGLTEAGTEYLSIFGIVKFASVFFSFKVQNVLMRSQTTISHDCYEFDISKVIDNDDVSFEFVVFKCVKMNGTNGGF